MTQTKYEVEADAVKTALDSTYVKKTEIVNDLTTGGTTKVLSAEQGKQLNTLIGNAISYINQ